METCAVTGYIFATAKTHTPCPHCGHCMECDHSAETAKTRTHYQDYQDVRARVFPNHNFLVYCHVALCTCDEATRTGAKHGSCGNFSASFTCSTCNQRISLTFALGKDGIELLNSPTDSRLLNSSHCKRVLALTVGEKLLISCGCCRSGITRLTLSPTGDGISFLSENYKERKIA